jgi:cytoskeletal protein CcmA (bactofilin family)
MIFSNKTKSDSSSASSSTTIIGSGVVLTGDITSTGDIRIDGTVKGNVSSSSRVLVGAEGVVEGNIDGAQSDVMGRIKGNVKTKELLNLRGNANITGDIFAGKLQVEPNVVFNGHCYMTGNVVEMSKENNEQFKKTASAK